MTNMLRSFPKDGQLAHVPIHLSIYMSTHMSPRTELGAQRVDEALELSHAARHVHPDPSLDGLTALAETQCAYIVMALYSYGPT